MADPIHQFSGLAPILTESSIGSVLDHIKNGDASRIVILSGAGVSTNSGIPDYRSSTGLFRQLSDEFKIDGPTLFSRSFALANPDIERHPIFLKLRQQMRDAKPTAAHHLAK